MTTPTVSRWWAPAGPHIGPDQTDIAMLAATGEDPRYDLGAALLAAHRVGAAACEQAAASPLVDEGAFIGYLVAAREQLADPMIDSVSKSVEGPGYACVLVRDVLDDAEEAALDLFRSAVSRGVAPPLAAARAGAVFGVSKAAIGKYRQKATDPRVNPVALADEADRTLFGYVEKLTAEEAAPSALQEVSKITPAARRRRAEEENRDRRGRFAVTDAAPTLSVSDLLRTQGHTEAAPTTEVGDSTIDTSTPGLLARMRQRYGFGGGTAPSRVGETAEEVAARERTEHATRAQQAARARKAAQSRQRRQAVQQAKARPVATGRTVTQRQSAPRQSVQRQSAQRTSVPRRDVRIADRVRARMGIAATTPPEPLQPVNADMDWLKLADASYTPHGDRLIDTEVGVALPEEQASAFRSKVAGRPGGLFRIGELTALTGGNNVEEVTGMRGDPYEQMVQTVSHQLGDAEPNAVFIGDDHRVFQDARGEADIENRLHVMAADMSSSQEGIATPYADAQGHGYHMVFQPEGKTVPHLVEFVAEDAIGHTTESASHPQWTLDPNQLYALGAFSSWETTYDDRGFLRTRIPISPVSEAEARRYIDEQFPRGPKEARDSSPAQPARRPWVNTEPRDSLGRWVGEQLGRAAAQPAADDRAARAHRANQARHARERRAKTRTSPTAPVRVAAPRQSAQRQSAQRQSAQRQGKQRLSVTGRRRIAETKEAVREVFATRSSLSKIHEFNFDPSASYAVMSNVDWNDLISRAGAPYENAEEVHVVGGDPRRMLEDNAADGGNAAEAVAEAYEIDEITGSEPMEMHHIASIEPGTDEEAGGMWGVINDLLERPGVAAVSAIPDNEDATLIHISTNRNRPRAIYLVELDPDLVDMPSTLEIGDHPSAVVTSESLWSDGSVTSYAVPVVFYRQVPLRRQDER